MLNMRFISNKELHCQILRDILHDQLDHGEILASFIIKIKFKEKKTNKKNKWWCYRISYKKIER